MQNNIAKAQAALMQVNLIDKELKKERVSASRRKDFLSRRESLMKELRIQRAEMLKSVRNETVSSLIAMIDNKEPESLQEASWKSFFQL
jgi:hypothetical protein